jgi:adenine phosphoribosyltransferase
VARRVIAHSLAKATRIQKGDYTYLVHPLLDGVPRCPPEMLREWLAWATPQPVLNKATVLAAPEAMALPLAAALSLATGTPYTVLRKRQYGLPGEVAAVARTGYASSTLYLNDLGPRDRVVVVDNVLSTGGTLDAILAACKDSGVPVLGCLVAIDKGDARKDLESRHGVPILAMHWVKVTRDGVSLRGT